MTFFSDYCVKPLLGLAGNLNAPAPGFSEGGAAGAAAFAPTSPPQPQAPQPPADAQPAPLSAVRPAGYLITHTGGIREVYAMERPPQQMPPQQHRQHMQHMQHMQQQHHLHHQHQQQPQQMAHQQAPQFPAHQQAGFAAYSPPPAYNSPLAQPVQPIMPQSPVQHAQSPMHHAQLPAWQPPASPRVQAPIPEHEIIWNLQTEVMRLDGLLGSMIRVHRQQLTVMMAQREAADRHTADVAAAHASQMASRFSEIQDLKGRIKALEQQADDARAPATPCQMGYQPGKEFAGQHQGVEAAAAAFEQVQLQAQAQAQARREVRLRHGAEMKALRMRLQAQARADKARVCREMGERIRAAGLRRAEEPQESSC
ncbi:hypothetical protein MNEG_9507 [Monoraphidium neglectum]|uniref:Uncharacterized protein n=1 Tax=Monoraphidium neglectum TaxID=145388 RepID=A0A0D2MVV3_9CHLO|nr:hypothetical protein MNEG_9507 [Monoraphidium neglectum]KIY98455.1 hypothetical protein MNEG_9507 [Monoraphidium neglectum]|eukprot:XP_013897475.1 hypothetical protein MNEG_9507 [Monoraphidium neglectum]